MNRLFGALIGAILLGGIATANPPVAFAQGGGTSSVICDATFSPDDNGTNQVVRLTNCRSYDERSWQDVAYFMLGGLGVLIGMALIGLFWYKIMQ